MAADTPSLKRLIRRWCSRLYWVALSEAFVCLCLGAALTVLVFLLLHVRGASPRPAVRRIAALLPLALLSGGLCVRRIRAARPWAFWALLLTGVLGWSSAWWAAPFVHVMWRTVARVAAHSPELTGPAAMLNHVAPFAVGLSIAGAVAALAAMLRLAPAVPEKRLLPWLDERVGSHLLLATAAELSRSKRPLSSVEQAVIRRAEALAARTEPFRGISVRRLGGRWWGLLAVAVAAVALAWWLASGAGLAAGPPGGASSVAGERPAAVRAAADRLYQFVLVAGGAGDPALAEGVRGTASQLARTDDPADARQAVEQARAALAAKVAAAIPLLEALSQLANQPAGQPLAAVLADPTQPTDRAVEAAARQVRAWQGRNLSSLDRAQLADQLRQAARRVAPSNAELADRLAKAADALAAGDWGAVTDQLGAIVRLVQPTVRGHRLEQAAVRAMDEALAALGEQPGPPAAPPPDRFATVPAIDADAAATPAPDPRWHGAQDRARQYLLTRSLGPDQQRLVRRYFALPE